MNVKLSVNLFDGGVCPTVALVNHSCRPNCGVAFHVCAPAELSGNMTTPLRPGETQGTQAEDVEPATCTFEIRSLGTLSAGSEITISYLEGRAQFQPAETRQGILHRWGFQCDCCRCKQSLAADTSDDLFISPGKLSPELCLAAVSRHCLSGDKPYDGSDLASNFVLPFGQLWRICSTWKPVPASDSSDIASLLQYLQEQIERASQPSLPQHRNAQGDSRPTTGEIGKGVEIWGLSHADEIPGCSKQLELLLSTWNLARSRLHPRHFICTRLHDRIARATRADLLSPDLRSALCASESKVVADAQQRYQRTLLVHIAHLRLLLAAVLVSVHNAVLSPPMTTNSMYCSP